MDKVIAELSQDNRIDQESGSLVIVRRFAVPSSRGGTHTVRVEVSHSGTPQHESCTCEGYRFGRNCKHIASVYAANLLGVDPEG